MPSKIPFDPALYKVLCKHWAGEPLEESEQVVFDAWLAASPDNSAVWQELNDESLLQQQYKDWSSYDREAAWDKVMALRSPSLPAKKPVRRLPYRWVAAAAILLLVVSGAYLLLQKQPVAPDGITAITDVAPGGNKAVLILGDGSRVTLDSTGSQVIRQGSTAIQQQAGQLNYYAQDDASAVNYNTLKTPRGGQFRIVLPDGTGVWLNAESSIRFPTAFRGKERLVEISGEAYFEVKEDPAMPFRVNAGRQVTIEVLGTNFNVNAYEDEAGIYTTLLQGAVKVSEGGRSALLKPGQQAQITTGIHVTGNADIEKVMAWKNGLFNFQDARLKEIMQQLSRWYDIEVEYQGNVPDTEYWGKMGRNLTLLEVLKGLEGAGLQFKLENNGKKLVVLTGTK